MGSRIVGKVGAVPPNYVQTHDVAQRGASCTKFGEPTKAAHFGDHSSSYERRKGKIFTWEERTIVGALAPEFVEELERSYFAAIGSVVWEGDDPRSAFAVKKGIELVSLGEAEVTITATKGEIRRDIKGGLLAKEGGEMVMTIDHDRARGSTRIRIALEGFEPRLGMTVYRTWQRGAHARYTKEHLLKTSFKVLEAASSGVEKAYSYDLLHAVAPKAQAIVSPPTPDES